MRLSPSTPSTRVEVPVEKLSLQGTSAGFLYSAAHASLLHVSLARTMHRQENEVPVMDESNLISHGRPVDRLTDRRIRRG